MIIQIEKGKSGRFGAQIVDETTGTKYFNLAGRYSEEYQAQGKAERANLGLPIYSTSGVRVA